VRGERPATRFLALDLPAADHPDQSSRSRRSPGDACNTGCNVRATLRAARRCKCSGNPHACLSARVVLQRGPCSVPRGSPSSP
jgi:hypothetical protein